MITGRNFVNSWYEEDEKLFSTGNEELDDILEEVYYSGISDGYDYAQREFTKTSYRHRHHNSKMVEKFTKLSDDMLVRGNEKKASKYFKKSQAAGRRWLKNRSVRRDLQKLVI